MLEWDRIDDRRYETGVDRGVIYLVEGGASVWNGLVSITESPARESKVYYQDGVKVLERLLAPAYSAKIQAFTYPDVVDTLMGNQSLAPGVNLHDQREGRFHLSYRTRIGSALEGTDHGYKLHLVYNLVINPEDAEISTISEEVAPTTFGWTVSAIPFLWQQLAFNHISLDSREVDPAKLAEIEDELYALEQMPDVIPLLESF